MQPLTKETVAVPVVRGVELRTAARMVPPSSLLEALNSRLSGGSRKRFGHVEHRIRSGSYPASTLRPNLTAPSLTPWGTKSLDDSFLQGWGYYISENHLSTTDVGDSFLVSEYPEAGYGFGIARRDNELLTWNGTRLFSHAASQAVSGRHGVVDPAVLPAMRAAQIAKSNRPQNFPDAADTGTVRMVTWLDADASQVYYSLYDTERGAPLVSEASLGFTDPYNPRCFSLGNWFHVLALEQSTGKLLMKSINQGNVANVVTRSLGDCERFYDFWKIDDTTAVLVINRDGTNVVLYYAVASGEVSPDYTSNVPVDYTGTDVEEVAICHSPVTGELGFTYISLVGGDRTIKAEVANTSGTILGVAHTVETIDSAYSDQPTRLTIAPRWIKTLAVGGEVPSGDRALFDVYWSHSDETTGTVNRQRYSRDALEGSPLHKWHQQIVSHAFRVGDRTYVWSAHASVLQSTWFLLDENLDPVGKLDFSVANVPAYATAASRDIHLASVNWSNMGTVKDQCVFHLALGYKERVATTADPAELTNLFTEPGVQFVELDFLPRLRSAQAGRCTYFAGAQLWSYDGEELTEAGFHLSPELFDVPTQGTGGALTALGTYVYRADLCYRNAQNEEVRSHSIIFDPVELTGGNNKITLTFKTMLTRRTDAYILIFRNAMVAAAPTSIWNLLNSRDPTSASFLINDQTQKTVTYEDAGAVSDADIQAREPHPGNSGTWVQPFSAPACELVAAGKSRLWVAGGELPPGQIAPSRLFTTGETPSFNANINIQVDRNAEPITALGFLGDVAAIFRYSQTYLQDGDGPDNEANGYWPTTRLGLSDSGAISQESLALIASGLLYQSPAGFRSINAAGGLVNRTAETTGVMGAPVDSIAKDFLVAGAVVVPEDQEVRWYGPTGTMVYNYLEESWSTWTCAALGAVLNPTSDRAALVTSGGLLWLEDESVWEDGDRRYEHRVRFPWLHGGSVGDFQRVRRILGLGAWDPTQPHTVRVEIYYDEREHLEEYWEWTVPDDSQNEDTWGSATWGAGSWGDTSGYPHEDSVWRWRRRPARQKCSVFSVAVSDAHSAGPGFTLVALGVELARKSGLDRVPWTTGGITASNR